MGACVVLSWERPRIINMVVKIFILFASFFTLSHQQCCPVKQVAGDDAMVGTYRYDPDASSNLQVTIPPLCMDSCFYRKDGNAEEIFCFKTEGATHDVMCEEEDTSGGGGGCILKENISWGEYQTTIDVPGGLAATFTVVITFSHPATVGSCHSGCDPSSVFSSQEADAATTLPFDYTPPTHNGIEPLRLFNIKRWPREEEQDFAEITSVTFDGQEQCN